MTKTEARIVSSARSRRILARPKAPHNMIRPRIDPTDTRPPYEHLRLQIATAITSGLLPDGTRLPTVGQLAGDLGIAPGTVMCNYARHRHAQLQGTW